MAEAEDKESKTEEASEKKIADAIEKGNVPFSREATLFASLLGVLAALAFLVAAPVAKLAGSLPIFWTIQPDSASVRARMRWRCCGARSAAPAASCCRSCWC